MFQEEDFVLIDSLFHKVDYQKDNYQIVPDDYISLDVYSNGGEMLIDPNFEFRKQTGIQNKIKEKPKYLVQPTGNVFLPLLGSVELSGHTLAEADSLLSVRYSEYYQDAFVITNVVNRRCVVLGPKGGKIIPLENENMTLIEVITLYGGLDERARAANIKIIRGDLSHPNVQLVDLSTLKGLSEASLQMNANDIVYIEPGRKILSESIRDVAPLFTILTSVMTLTVLIINLR